MVLIYKIVAVFCKACTPYQTLTAGAKKNYCRHYGAVSVLPLLLPYLTWLFNALWLCRQRFSFICFNGFIAMPYLTFHCWGICFTSLTQLLYLLHSFSVGPFHCYFRLARLRIYPFTSSVIIHFLPLLFHCGFIPHIFPSTRRYFDEKFPKVNVHQLNYFMTYVNAISIVPPFLSRILLLQAGSHTFVR